MLFVVKCRYWTCRAGNDADELNLTADRIRAKALANEHLSRAINQVRSLL